MRREESVAVVIPLYNKGPHIERALASALGQSVAPDEIIIVDDASTDDGVERVSRIADPRIRIIRRDRPGPGGYAARNAGIEAARSEWIAFLDADDAWAPEAMAEVKRLIGLADDGVGSLFTAYARDYGDGVPKPVSLAAVCPGDHRRLDFADFLEAWLKIGFSPMWTSAVTARRSALIEAGLFPAGKCDRGGDKDTWLRLLSVADAICSPKANAIYHRDSVNMVTKTTSAAQRPYLCTTLETLLPSRDADEAKLMRRLINWEMLYHAQDAWRSRHRISPDLFRGFIVQENPLAYALLFGMAHAPGWALDASHGAKSLKTMLNPRKARRA